MSDITITGYCAKCNQWFTPDFLATLRLSAHAGGDVCLNCLADKSWSYLIRHVCTADYPKVARYKQFVVIKQDYTSEENAAYISEATSIIDRAMHGSDVTKTEMEYIYHAFNTMNDRIASLEAVIVAKDAEISQLQADNRSLVEQMNQIAMRMEHKSGKVQRIKS